MLGVSLADDAHYAAPLDDLAVLADWLHARPNFHKNTPVPTVKMFRGDPNSN
jgi:hypothetical protein